MEVESGRKSDHKGEEDGEVAKRRKIDTDAGIAERERRVEEKEDGSDDEKMEVEELSTKREAVTQSYHKSEEEDESVKLNPYVGEREHRAAAVVFAEWQRKVEKRESGEDEGGECEATDIGPDEEWQMGMQGEDDSDKAEMEMEVKELVLVESVKNNAGKINTREEEKMRWLKQYEEWKKRKEEQMVDPDPEDWTDIYAYEARSFEKLWNQKYGNWIYGSYHDETQIPCRRFTYKPAPNGGMERCTLQVFSVKVAEITGGLQWPLNVFGTVALRDSVDQNRNVIFDRNRDNCQTLTEQNPYLILTGPVRAVVLCGRVVFQVSLNVRGTVKSEDKEISLLAASFMGDSSPFDSFLINEYYPSKLTTLEFALGHILFSVEATISVQVTDGSWPDGFRGQFAARTASINKEIMLLDSCDDKLPIHGDEIKLLRRVVSVESDGTLFIIAKALQGDNLLVDEKDFTPLKMDKSSKTLTIGDCKMNATVEWSLFSVHPKLM